MAAQKFSGVFFLDWCKQTVMFVWEAGQSPLYKMFHFHGNGIKPEEFTSKRPFGIKGVNSKSEANVLIHWYAVRKASSSIINFEFFKWAVSGLAYACTYISILDNCVLDGLQGNVWNKSLKSIAFLRWCEEWSFCALMDHSYRQVTERMNRFTRADKESADLGWLVLRTRYRCIYVVWMAHVGRLCLKIL